MAIEKSQVSKTIDLNLPANLEPSIAADIKAEVGEFVVTSILDYVGQGRSPVAGFGSFQKLSKTYATDEKGGRTLPNLELDGDMLRALTFSETRDGVEVGIFDADQAIKAYGHITGMKGHPWLDGVTPARVFMPGTKGAFKREIESGIRQLVNERLVQEVVEPREAPRRGPSDERPAAEIQADLRAGVIGTSSAASSQGIFGRTLRDILSGE